MPVIKMRRKYIVEKQEMWVVYLPEEELESAENDFLDEGRPTAELDQHAVDYGYLLDEDYDYVDDDHLGYEIDQTISGDENPIIIAYRNVRASDGVYEPGMLAHLWAECLDAYVHQQDWPPGETRMMLEAVVDAFNLGRDSATVTDAIIYLRALVVYEPLAEREA